MPDEVSWNLVDLLSPMAGPRRFTLPLAVANPQSVAPERFEVTDPVRSTPPDRLSSPPTQASPELELPLRIQVKPPQGGFLPVGGRPDPALNLHAICRGSLTFLPAITGKADRLMLIVRQTFETIADRAVPWWQRWVEAECIPGSLVYENVDRAQLADLVGSLRAGQPAASGLSLPPTVTAAECADYLKRFLAGDQTAPIWAVEGAVIGSLAADADGAYALKLYAYYTQHTATDPWPMHPRELFHLLFGERSDEAIQHPLLRRIQAQGSASTEQPATKRMLLRPPLRTWKRVIWEADLEIAQHVDRWKPYGNWQGVTDAEKADAAANSKKNPIVRSSKPARLDNTATLGRECFLNGWHMRQLVGGSQPVFQRFNYGDYADSWTDLHKTPASFQHSASNKCNLFTGEIAVRAGFHCCVHLPQTGPWNFASASAHVTLAIQGKGEYVIDRGVPLKGHRRNSNVVWGYRSANWLQQRIADDGTTDLRELLRTASLREGRCFIVAGSRKGKTSGHIVFAGTFENAPILSQPKKGKQPQVRCIQIVTREASFHGARQRPLTMRVNGESGCTAEATEGGASGNLGFVYVQLIELRPGRDPHTIQGLGELNVDTGCPPAPA